MYRNFHGASSTAYFGNGRGYEEKDILETVNTIAGSDFTRWFECFVQGTDPLPYGPTLALAGLKLRADISPGSPPSLGALVRREGRGIRIVAVHRGRAADRGGLARDDFLIDVDNLSLASTELDSRLKINPPGAQVPFTVERHGRLERVFVTLEPPIAGDYAIEELPRATAEQLQVRNGWLGN